MSEAEGRVAGASGDESAAALERLRSRVQADAAALEDVERIARALTEAEARRGVELRLRRSHAALMALARSDAISRGALDEALRQIMEGASQVLGVERSSAWLYNADQTAIRCIDLFIRSESSHESGVELPQSTFPGYFRALKEERSIAAHDAHTDPRTSEFSASYLAPLGIGAMLDAPIRAGGRMIGVLCNEHIGPKRTWSADEELFAASVADLVALAIESARRHDAEAQLRAAVESLEGAG